MPDKGLGQVFEKETVVFGSGPRFRPLGDVGSGIIIAERLYQNEEISFLSGRRREIERRRLVAQMVLDMAPVRSLKQNIRWT